MDAIDLALYRTFMLRFQAGLFDPIEGNYTGAITVEPNKRTE